MSPSKSSAVTGQVVAFPGGAPDDDREALIAALAALHTLITLDPVLGASPVRTYFVLNPQARRRIAECLSPHDRTSARYAPGYALVAYDFPFAVHLIETTAPQMSGPDARRLASLSAGLQADSLPAAAGAVGLEMRPIAGFDEDALKAVFFPNTQETVTHVFRLDRHQSPIAELTP